MRSANVTTLFTLGDYTRYKAVFYRVYNPGSDSQSRDATIIATSLGPLAITAANLASICNSNDKCSFHLIAYVPVTLATVNNNKCDTNKISELLKDFKRFYEKVREDIRKVVNDAAKEASSVIKNDKELLSNKDLLAKLAVVNLEIRSDTYTHPEDNKKDDESKPLPSVAHYEAELVVETFKEINNQKRYEGIVTFILTPLTGSFQCGQNRVVFREATSKDIEAFGNAIEAVYLLGLHESLKWNLNRRWGEEESTENAYIRFLVDTTHGLNSAASILSKVVYNAEQLLVYEAYRHGIGRVEVLYYNSDPAIGLGRENREALMITRQNNVSYYYSMRGGLPLRTLLSTLEEYARESLEEGLKADGQPRILHGIYLLSYGLLPWGLHLIEHSARVANKTRRMTGIIKLSFDEERSAAKYYVNPSYRDHPYEAVIAKWIEDLARIAVEKYTEKDILHRASRLISEGCWEGIQLIDIDRNARCYSIELLHCLVKELQQNGMSQQKEDWYVRFLRSFIEPTAAIIVKNEIGEWQDNMINRLKYIAVRVLEPRHYDNRSNCSNLFGESKIPVETEGGDRGYYCITPMRLQDNIRNIIAHAGLTGVNRGTALIFTDKKQDNITTCELAGICIAAMFPRKHLEHILNKTEAKSKAKVESK